MGKSSCDVTIKKIKNSKHKNLLIANKIKIINKSFFDININKELKNILNEEIFIICLEVFDNFPHDRICINKNSNDKKMTFVENINSN